MCIYGLAAFVTMIISCCYGETGFIYMPAQSGNSVLSYLLLQRFPRGVAEVSLLNGEFWVTEDMYFHLSI